MDPYDVLGVNRDASTEEIEARYRLLIREYHPDVHHAEGPDAVASAQQMTQRLNIAMDAIRNGDAGPPAAPRPGGRWGDDSFFRYTRPAGGAAADEPGRGETTWEQPPPDPDDPVPCPFCGLPFLRLADYEAHLAERHGFRRSSGRTASGRGSQLVEAIGKVRYVPAWLVALLGLGSWLVFGFPEGMLLFVCFMAFLALVLWAQTTPRFRSRRSMWE